MASAQPELANKAVQAWLKAGEPLVIALNNVLGKVIADLADHHPQAQKDDCGRLTLTAFAYLHHFPSPDLKLSQLEAAGIRQYIAAGKACAAGNLGQAQRAIAAGTKLRADAQDPISELLEEKN